MEDFSVIASTHHAVTTVDDIRPAPQPETPAADIAALRYMHTRLAHAIDDSEPAASPPPHIIYLPEPQRRQHRVVLMSAAALRAGTDLTFVGFFGQKRPGLNDSVLDALDIALINEFQDYPHMVSYSSLELAGGAWGNLVLMSSPEGITRWAASTRHAYAARQVAPHCYTTIRLHRGVLAAGAGPNSALQLRDTKLFEFPSG